MGDNEYGTATAQDLYEMFIGSGALKESAHWELDDDEDQGPVPRGWYVIVKVQDELTDWFQRRLHADLLWVAILACASRKVERVPWSLAEKCYKIVHGGSIGAIRIERHEADIVMQVALLGRVHHQPWGTA